jgi:hypothetical protein
MNEVMYFTIRSQHYSQLAMDASDSRLKVALEAIAVDMSAKVVTADPSRQVSGSEPVQEAMDERMDRRVKLRRRGWLSATTGAELEECIIWDESTIGARLVVAIEYEISDTFHLYMSFDATWGRHCRVVWRSGTQIGVEFMS